LLKLAISSALSGRGQGCGFVTGGEIKIGRSEQYCRAIRFFVLSRLCHLQRITAAAAIPVGL
jgi:hypothetical protein